MKATVAAISTFVFMVTTAGLMLHACLAITAGASVPWLIAWLPFVAISALAMALTDAPAPLEE